MLRIDAEFLHHFRAGRAQAEAVQTDHFPIEADVLIPDVGHPGFDRDAFATFVRQDLFPIFSRFAIETFRAWHGNYACPSAKFFRRGQRML